jgi:hypothetical protein
MFSKEQLQGILLTLPKTEVHIARTNQTNIGYRIRIRINMRGCEEFLLRVQRTLLQYNIDSTYKDREHGSRPKPILRISGKRNLLQYSNIVSTDLPDSKGNWIKIKEIIEIYCENQHSTLEGLERILFLKGEI